MGGPGPGSLTSCVALAAVNALHAKPRTRRAGQIGYALAPQIARGAMFGPHQRVQLRLMDREEARNSLDGLRLELLDCCHELLAGVCARVQRGVQGGKGGPAPGELPDRW